MRRGLVLAVLLACLAAAVPATAHTASASAPVPSLEPRATQQLYARLRDRQVFRTYRVSADCRPLRAVFYAASDWLRLATRLAAYSSPCAQYYISVPPVVGQKTRARPGPGDAHPRPRAAVPRPRGDPPHLVAEVGRVDRVVLVPGGSRGAPQHGRRRLRRHGRRLVGRQRAHVGDPARRRREARRDPRLPPRPLRRGRRRARRRRASSSSSASASASRRSGRTRRACRSGSRTRRSGAT